MSFFWRAKKALAGHTPIETVVTEIKSEGKRAKIPTTFVPLSPEKVLIDGLTADLLCGVFHIMWSDMPTPRTYGIKLAENFSRDGSYIGCELVCSFPKSAKVLCMVE